MLPCRLLSAALTLPYYAATSAPLAIITHYIQSVENEREVAEVLIADDLHIDIDRRRVIRGEKLLEINHPLLFELLIYLVRYRGIAVTREQLMAHVWGYQMKDSRTVYVHVCWLRQKLEDDPENPQHFQTVRGVGYRFKD